MIKFNSGKWLYMLEVFFSSFQCETLKWTDVTQRSNCIVVFLNTLCVREPVGIKIMLLEKR